MELAGLFGTDALRGCAVGDGTGVPWFSRMAVGQIPDPGLGGLVHRQFAVS